MDKEAGGGAINMTTIIVFQEISDYAVSTEHKVPSRNVNVDFGKHDVAFYDKQEPINTYK